MEQHITRHDNTFALHSKTSTDSTTMLRFCTRREDWPSVWTHSLTATATFSMNASTQQSISGVYAKPEAHAFSSPTVP